MDAILVKYIGPSNTRPARMKATMGGHPSITRAYDSELSAALNARQAAQDLLKTVPFNRHLPFWSMGILGQDYVFVNHCGKPHLDQYSIDTRNWE